MDMIVAFIEILSMLIPIVVVMVLPLLLAAYIAHKITIWLLIYRVKRHHILNNMMYLHDKLNDCDSELKRSLLMLSKSMVEK